jgi:hypothetical protein
MWRWLIGPILDMIQRGACGRLEMICAAYSLLTYQVAVQLLVTYYYGRESAREFPEGMDSGTISRLGLGPKPLATEGSATNALKCTTPCQESRE